MYGLVYIHTCSINGKSYVGQTTKSMKERWKEHLFEKRPNKFHNALKKYNEKYWKHKILAFADSKEDLDALEDYFIKKYNTIENGYNSKEGGSHGKHTEETKKNISEKKKGVGCPHTEQTKSKISKALKGRCLSKAHKENLSKSKKGRNWTDKQKESLRGKFSGKNNPNYGKKTTQDAIRKMREKQGKKIICVETGEVFLCAGEAAEKLGVKRCGIQRCLIKGGTSHGFHWTYI